MNDRRSPSRCRSGAAVSALRRGTLATAAAVAVIGAAAACSSGFGVEDSDTLRVHGRVTYGVTDSPVADAEIDVTAFSGTCGSNIFSSASASTDSTGRYQTTVINFRSGFRRCVEVRAVPPESSGLRSDLVSVPNVSLDVDSLSLNIALDSVSGS